MTNPEQAARQLRDLADWAPASAYFNHSWTLKSFDSSYTCSPFTLIWLPDHKEDD